MGFGHEKLDGYRAAIDYIGWAYRFCEGLQRHRNAKDQLLRASPTKMLLDRIVTMLTKLGQRGYAIHEEPGEYRAGRNDTDSDTDPDSDGNMKPENSKPSAAPNPAQGRHR
jgi:hypothetical protein